MNCLDTRRGLGQTVEGWKRRKGERKTRPIARIVEREHVREGDDVQAFRDLHR